MVKISKYLFLIVLIFAAARPLRGFAKDESQEINSMRNDIQIINLLNGLDLTREQNGFIVSRAQEVKDLRQAEAGEIAAYKADALKAYGAIKTRVAAGRVTVEKEDAKKFLEVKDKAESITKESQIKIDKIADEVEGKLEKFQLIALDGYKPCIIPKISQGRIGQAEDNTPLLKILEKVEAAPDARYARMKDKAAEKIVSEVKKKTPVGVQVDEAAVKTEILNTFGAARSMDKTDFLIKKESIAQGLNDNIFPATASMTRKQKIKRFLLSENIIDILKKNGPY